MRCRFSAGQFTWRYCWAHGWRVSNIVTLATAFAIDDGAIASPVHKQILVSEMVTFVETLTVRQHKVEV